jgi:glycosyltransferase involved in cell wall biosynthesis
MLEFMSCARPVIVGVEGQARQIVEEANAGIAIEPENPCALVHAITRLWADQAFRCELGENGRRYITERFSRAETADKFLRILHTLAGN